MWLPSMAMSLITCSLSMRMETPSQGQRHQLMVASISGWRTLSNRVVDVLLFCTYQEVVTRSTLTDCEGDL
uniref:Putative secreted protein n=1 Tax=Anopheles marajoara TaxID=58244 RepID=A0A2M4CE92_9DIPT